MEKRNPCYECEKRVLGCHSTCEEYKAFSENKKAASSKKIEADKKHYLASDTAFKLKAKLYKRYGRH
jgi:hypothetical protein